MRNKNDNRQKRKMHIRKTLSGSSVKPRIFVFKSNKFFYAGVANDDTNTVLMSKMSKKKSEEITKMAVDFATKFKELGHEVAVFDRSGYKYHGLIAVFADELRKSGIKI
jgi:large subunit ribosomal protein L18